MLALHDAGYGLLVPFGENTRYDLVIDGGDGLRRVQCKTGRLRLGSICFNVCSSYAHHPNPKLLRRDYRGEVDCFAVYCPETEGIYLIPIDDLGVGTQGSLRLEAPRNNQRRRIRYASDYELARLSLSSGLRASSGGRRSFA
jgi:hypothetical protein